LTKEKGIEGKKGVLWWQIYEIIKEKKPPFILLENVDRLIKSPAMQRGRDFGIMLRCLNDKGYIVEWRVINAANYGFPQRRRRVFIFASRKDTNYATKISKKTIIDIINKNGIFAKTFKIQPIQYNAFPISIIDNYPNLVALSNDFEARFFNTGIMMDGQIYTIETNPILEEQTPLAKILLDNVEERYYLSEERIKKFEYLRKSKRIPRIKPNGERYIYTEGAMKPFDSHYLPGRTMLTSEGTLNRSTHIIKDAKGVRILTPIECEKLNQFPENWTDTMPERKRYFMMGNALVCGIIRKLGIQISKIIDKEK
jgi:DNA (cytosine-5)-methyltransferase 1